MTTANLRVGAWAVCLAAAGLLSGCPAGGPRLPDRAVELAAPGTLGAVQPAVLDAARGPAELVIRYALPAPGGMRVRVEGGAAAAATSVLLEIWSAAGKRLAAGPPPLEVGKLAPGEVLVVARPAGPGRLNLALRADFRPDDPEAAGGPQRAAAGAAELPADHGYASGSVDFSAMRRTQYWRIAVPAEGSLTLRFRSGAPGVEAELLTPRAPPEKIPATGELRKDDAVAGDAFVRVTAAEPGDAGAYELFTSFRLGDACRAGGSPCSLEGAEELRLPADNKLGDVDASAGRQLHFYRLTATERGRLTLHFKLLQPAHAPRVAAYLLRNAADPGERIGPGPLTKDIDAPGELFVRVQAPEPGDAARYSLQALFQPENFIVAEVVEVGTSPCLLTVDAGSDKGVRAGASCTVLSAAGSTPLEACTVQDVYARLAKVRPASPSCRIPRIGSKVQIHAP